MNQATTPVPGQAKSPPPLPFARPTMTCICSETDEQALHLYKHLRPPPAKRVAPEIEKNNSH
jgi:hypothetical protein